jgi:hypothetical protein
VLWNPRARNSHRRSVPFLLYLMTVAGLLFVTMYTKSLSCCDVCGLLSPG